MVANRAKPSAGFDIKAVLGPWHELPVVGIFGPMSSGKDFDAWTALAGRCFGVGPPGGLTKPSIASGYPIDPSLYGPARTIDEARATIAATVQVFPGRFLGVIVTDVSVLSAATHDQMRPNYSESHNFTFWRDFGMKHNALIETIRWSGLLGVLTGHVKEGGINKQDGKFYKGGLKTPGRETTKTLAHSLDLGLRCGTEPSRYGPWKGIYYCSNNHPDWEEKDRHGLLEGIAPQNLAEILRAAGYRLPRAPGLEWQEEWASGIAAGILAGKPAEQIVPKVMDHLMRNGVSEALANWAVRDGVDRALLAQQRRSLRRGWGNG